jgi:hypothetical protein
MELRGVERRIAVSSTADNMSVRDLASAFFPCPRPLLGKKFNTLFMFGNKLSLGWRIALPGD